MGLCSAQCADAVLHRTQRSDQTRYQAYFRLYRSDRPEGKEGTFPEALLDTWHEFEGMRDVVREMREQEQENGSAGSTAAAAVAARL